MPPSAEHGALLLLFENRPQLALELLHWLGLGAEAAEPASLENVDLTTAVTAEYRADLVVCYRGGRSPLVVAVEVQLARDQQKRFSWPAYAVLLRARFRCDVQLLVVAPRRSVARWCARPIRLGNGAVFTPTVVGPDIIPVVTDPELARLAPELAVLSAIAHGRGELSQAVAIGFAGLQAMAGLETDRGMVYNDLVRSALGQAARKVIDAMIPEGYKWKSDFARKHIAEGEARGKARGRAEAVIAFLEARGISLAASEREKVLACTNLRTLDRWVRRAATVQTASELFD